MNKKYLVAFVVLLFLYSCGQDDSATNKNLNSDNAIIEKGDINISIDVASELADDIEIVSAQGSASGVSNPVESTVTVKNRSDEKKELLIKGEWFDSKGNGYGGVSDVITLEPLQSETLKAGTQSKGVSVYKLSLTLANNTKEQLLGDALSNPSQKIAEGYGMTWSLTALDEVIPAIPLTGVANGEPFHAGTITFRQDHKGAWKLEVSDYVYDPVKGIAAARLEKKDIQIISIWLPEQPSVGNVIGRDMTTGGGYFQIKTSPTSDETASWNASFAYALHMEDWQMGPSSIKSCGIPEVGKASGKLYISFQGSGLTIKDSWVSGEFKDAAIIYCGADS